MRYLHLGLAALAATASTSFAQDAQQRVEWNRPSEPFQIIANVYSVGTAGLGAYLVTGPQGHVLIDGGLPESAPWIAANIEKLGFRLEDVEYLLINHAHADHAGGLAELKRRTGARLVASVGDRPDLEAGRTIGRSDVPTFPPVAVDRLVADGDTLTLGGIRLTAHLTPGHTRGCTSWSLETGGRTVLFACSLTVAGQKLVGNAAYPRAAEDFRRSFAKLGAMRADVFLNFHPESFGMQEKRARQLGGDANAFVDPGELARQVQRAERGFEEALAEQKGE